MTQTGAIFMEAYRNLNSKKLFWIVLVISGLVAGLFAALGINEDGLTVFSWPLGAPFGINSEVLPPAEFYKVLFVEFGIGWWLSWIATGLALVSTAGIFVDLMTGGSIDLVLSKPIGRLRLFVTQYAAALLFVALQVTVFTVAVFLVLGIRGGAWEPALFLAVPVVVCFFSYIYSVCVLLGVITRSTVAALLLTLLVWFGLSMLSFAEQTILLFDTMDKQGTSITDLSNGQRGRRSGAKDLPTPPAPPAPPAMPDSFDPFAPPDPPDPPDPPAAPGPPAPPAPPLGDEADDPQKPEKKKSQWLSRTHDVVYAAKTVLPKTDETVGLLERWLIDMANLEDWPGDTRPQEAKNLEKAMVETIHGRSVAWIVGTSLGFELLVLSLAAFLFCRRDY